MNVSEFAQYWLGSRSQYGLPISINEAAVKGCEAGIQECMNRLRLFFCQKNKEYNDDSIQYDRGYQDCLNDMRDLFNGWIE